MTTKPIAPVDIPYETEVANLTAAKAWTVADVRRILPAVDAIVDGTRVTCTVVGRKCDFAIVRSCNVAKPAETHFAWPTVAAAMNSGRALRF